MSKYLLSLVFLCATHCLMSQGWERIYSGGGFDEVQDVAITPDGGYILAGTYLGNSLQISKVDIDGYLQWTKFNVAGPQTRAAAIKVLEDSSLVIAGTKWNGNGTSTDLTLDAFLLKTDFSGNVIWMKTLGIPVKADETSDMAVLPDGSFVIVGTNQTDEQLRIFKADAAGNLLWSQQFGLANGFIERGNGIAIANNGDIVVVGERQKFPNTQDIYIVRVAQDNGATVWETEYETTPNTAEVGNSIVALPAGGFVVAGVTTVPNTSFTQGVVFQIDDNPVANPAPVWKTTFSTLGGIVKAEGISDIASDNFGGFILSGKTPEVAGVKSDVYMARLAQNGDIIWENNAGKIGLSNGLAVSPTSGNDGFVAVGYTSTSADPFQLQRYAYMLRADFVGQFFSNYLSGKVYSDANNDCAFQTGEPGLNKWLVRFSSPDFTRYATTDDDGNYFIMVDTGVYDVKVFPPNGNWNSCLATLTIPVTNLFDTTVTNISIKKGLMCPYNEVDIQTAILRRCVDNPYTVRYCNSGTVPSQNTVVTVEKSPGFTITAASLPYTVSGDSLVFEIGNLNPGDCGSFTINAFLDCNTELNTAHCMRAHISPDSFCSTANWNGSLIEARARCENDSVKLSLVNKGINPATNLNYIVVDDIVVLFVDPNLTQGITGVVNTLNASQDTLVWKTPANGRTYRIISEQDDSYPGLSVPTAAVEGCATDTNTVSTGYYTMFSEDDNEPFAASDCQETYEATFNPTFLKRGHPKGYKEPRYIYPETDVDYLIRFQNTGSDTISQVIIRDTLSTWLDPASVRPGASSHPYTFSIYGEGIVSFQLTNINLLPAGSSSSEGFVKFRVSQKPGVPCDTQLLNRAAIYFDFNAPVHTNETFHTVCESFVEIDTITSGSNHVYVPGAGLRIYPNPFVTSTTMEVTGVQASSYQIALFDAQGRLVFNQISTDSTFRLFRHQLPSGYLYYRLAADGRPVASGKLLVH